MAFYTAYVPPAGTADPLTRAMVIKDGFSWPAFLLTGVWLLWKRLWLAFFGFVLFHLGLATVQMLLGVSPGAIALAQLGIGLFLGLEGQNLIARKLAAKGWTLADVVEGVNQDQAERRFFERALEAGPAAGQPAPMADPAPAPAAPVIRRETAPPVIGVFPEARGR